MHTPKLLPLAMVLLLPGCAQTVWVRPGTSLAEAQHTLRACEIQANEEVSPSHLRVARGHKIGAELANVFVNAVVEGLELAAARRQCMIAEGFHEETVQPAPATRYAAAPLPSPQAQTASPIPDPVLAVPEPMRPVMPQYVAAAALPPEPVPSTVPAPSRAADPGPPIVMVRADPMGPTTSVARRTLMTTEMMQLSDNSPMKRSFLLGACSAGDETACILTETMPPGRPPRASNAAVANTRGSGVRMVAN